jgi:hypothetical protein
MKKLKDFEGQKIAIHFPTYELWLRRREINPSDNLLDQYFKQGYCYYAPFDTNGRGDAYSSIDGFLKSKNYTILPATDFLEEEFIYGQEYEFSNDDDFQSFCKRQYIAKSPCREYFISWNFNEKLPSWFKYCRKINTERTEAITTAKELINKFDIKQEELFNE